MRHRPHHGWPWVFLLLALIFLGSACGKSSPEPPSPQGRICLWLAWFKDREVLDRALAQVDKGVHFLVAAERLSREFPGRLTTNVDCVEASGVEPRLLEVAERLDLGQVSAPFAWREGHAMLMTTTDRHRLQGRELLRQGQYKEAEEELRRDLALQPIAVASWHLLAVCHTARRDFAGALKALDMGLTYAPHDAALLNDKGSTLVTMGRASEAVEFLQRAHKASPQDPMIMGNLAWALVREGREVDEAESLLRRALDKQPDNAQLWSTLGEVRQAQGHHAAAVVAFYRAARLDPASGHNSRLFKSLMALDQTTVARLVGPMGDSALAAPPPMDPWGKDKPAPAGAARESEPSRNREQNRDQKKVGEKPPARRPAAASQAQEGSEPQVGVKIETPKDRRLVAMTPQDPAPYIPPPKKTPAVAAAQERKKPPAARPQPVVKAKPKPAPAAKKPQPKVTPPPKPQPVAAQPKPVVVSKPRPAAKAPAKPAPVKRPQPKPVEVARPKPAPEPAAKPAPKPEPKLVVLTPAKPQPKPAPPAQPQPAPRAAQVRPAPAPPPAPVKPPPAPAPLKVEVAAQAKTTPAGQANPVRVGDVRPTSEQEVISKVRMPIPMPPPDLDQPAPGQLSRRVAQNPAPAPAPPAPVMRPAAPLPPPVAVVKPAPPAPAPRPVAPKTAPKVVAKAAPTPAPRPVVKRPPPKPLAKPAPAPASAPAKANGKSDLKLPSGYLVQVATFRDPGLARQEAANWQRRGFKVVVEAWRSPKGKSWQRVLLGPYATRTQALKAGQALKLKGKILGFGVIPRY